jgi:hypothetical protein
MYLWKDLFEEDLPEYPLGVNAALYVNPPGLFKLEKDDLKKRLGPEWAMYIERMQAEIDEMKKNMPPQYPFAYGLEEHPEPSNVKIHIRGNPDNLGDEAPRGYLTWLSDGPPKSFEKGSGRMDLAEKIVKEPLAHRVIVNRIWRWHMGSGIVNTPSNFGNLGERPTNPELLDYLAQQFVANGMSWKKLHKQIVMSRAYQLSSMVQDSDSLNSRKDPDNRLYWRANRRRLEAEGLWDLLLAAAGQLDLSKTEGPSGRFTETTNYRGVYAKSSRMAPDPFQQIWDFPPATISSEGRYNTNVPLQRLFFLNNDIFYSRAAALAERVSSAGNFDAQVRKAYELVYQRTPTPAELTTIKKMTESLPDPNLESVPAGADLPRRSSPLKLIAWALLSSNEFLYID